MIFLEDDAIILRPLELIDAEGNYPAWLNDAKTCVGNDHHRMPYSRRDAEDYIAGASDSSDSIVLAIVNKSGGQHVGNISLQDINWFSRSAELAVVIGEADSRGGGIGFRASCLLIDHGFVELNLHSIQCMTFSNNSAMIGLAKNLGMKHVGSFREAAYKNGQYLNVEIFDLLRSEYSPSS